MCAWHGALAELLAIAGSHKTPAVTGRKGNADKARAVSRNGASEGSMRQDLCTQRTANQLYGSGKEVEQSWQSKT
jgi:hypothetical protein